MNSGDEMVLISYDISDNKKRAHFSKFLCKFGHRIQYSVFEIDNSDRLLENIICTIENKFSKTFDQSDSIYIFKMSSNCKVIKYGYAKNEDKELIIIK